MSAAYELFDTSPDAKLWWATPATDTFSDFEPSAPLPRLLPPELLPLFPVREEQDSSWQSAAMCAQADPEAFFPEQGGSTKEAKRVCQDCPVRTECLAEALENDERFGVWGGLSERERRALRKADE